MITKIRLFILIIFIGYVKGRDDWEPSERGEIIEPKKSNIDETITDFTPLHHTHTKKYKSANSISGKDPGGNQPDPPDFDPMLNPADSKSEANGKSPGPDSVGKPGPGLQTEQYTFPTIPQYTTPPTEVTTPSLEVDTLDSVTSVQGLLAEMKTNEMIEQKIIDAMNEFSSNCNIFNPITLSLKNYAVPADIRFNIADRLIASFKNLRINETNEEKEEWKTHNIVIACSPGENVQIRVSVPIKITVATDVEIINSSDDVIDKGTMSLSFRGISVSRNIRPKTNYDVLKIPEFSFEKSEVSLDIDMSYQLPIYRRLDSFFDNLKGLESFYSRQLRLKLDHQNLSLPNSCSKVGSARTNPSLNNMYVIPDVKFETWKGLTLSAGPILIDGLLNFNSSEFVATKPDLTVSKADDIPENKAVKRIRTVNLKGKFEWKYRGKIDVLPFTIDSIDFENIFTKKVTTSSQAVTESHDVKSGIHVRVGKVEIQPSGEKYCQNENHFANFILSEYIQKALGELLKESITKKFKSEGSLQQCANF